MGSIGYIGGNIAYMGGGNMTMEYPYENSQGHYPLWKPPSSYFPRGEAPPPYEEAVAQAQAEAAINTCTVSVATTHRTLPLNVCNNQDDGITTNTTNLINININNAGTITSVAAGENHQISSLSTTSLSSTSNTQPRSTQTNQQQHSHHQQQQQQLTMNQMDTGNSRNTTVSVCAFSSNQQLDQQPQTNPSTPSRAAICNSLACHAQKEVQTSNSLIDNSGTVATIIPPPMFATFENSGRHNIGVATPSSSRRYHRTIPRHFTSIDPLNVEQGTIGGGNKKPTCQCPIQHVPMTSYMGAHFAHQTNQQKSNSVNTNTGTGGIFMTSLSTKLNGTGSTGRGGNHREGSHTLNRRSKQSSNHSNGLMANSSTLGNSGGGGSGGGNGTSGKIATISKQIVQASANDGQNIHSILKNKPLSSASMSSLKMNGDGSVAANLIKATTTTDILNPPFPIPFIDSKTTTPDGDSMIDHPVLPPKMYKNNNKGSGLSGNNSGNNGSHSNHLHQKIHTISKPNSNHHSSHNISGNGGGGSGSHHHHSTNSQQNQHNPQYSTVLGTQVRSNSMRMSFPNNNHNQMMHFQQNVHSTKSLRRNNGGLSGHNNIPGGSNIINNNHNNLNGGGIISAPIDQSIEKSQSLVKINSAINFPSANHITYSLPKQSANNKLTLRSTITDVVSKVPSVITIPSPSSSTSSPTINPMIISTSSSNQLIPMMMTTSTTNSLPSNVSLNNHNNINTLINNNTTNNNNNNTKSPGSATSMLTMAADDKPLPVCTTSKNCSNPKEHFLPNDTSLDDDYLSECENCKSAHGSRYYLDEEIIDSPQETMTLQRKPTENQEEEMDYYRTSQTLPTNTKQKTTTIKNREPWFSTIPASSSSDEEINE